jgi:hypothetical protein
VLCLIGVVGVLGLTTAAALAAGGVRWGSAIEVPGTTALGPGGDMSSVSCGSAGNCAAVGTYVDGSNNVEAFVVDEKNGAWGDAVEVPGTAALNVDERANGSSVACASAGNCAAVGSYTDASDTIQVFVADERNGVWGDAVEMPGTAALNVGGRADVSSVSCASAGNCAAGGFYTDGSGGRQAFLADEVGGVWSSAIEVPGSAALNTLSRDIGAGVSSISCRSTGNCTAGGNYEAASTGEQPFVVDEKDGVWGTARPVRGTASINTNYEGRVNAVSCSSDGNCVAGGSYTPKHYNRGRQTAFVVTEKNGVWGKPIDVPRIANPDWYAATVLAVSCASVGNCAAGGSYEDVNFGWHAFVVAEKRGVWRAAVKVPGTIGGRSDGTDPLRANAAVTSISCASAGHCLIGGYTNQKPRTTKAFVETEKADGSWGTAVQVPGTAALALGYAHVAFVASVSCVRTGKCVAAGTYDDAGVNTHPFVTTP